MMGRKRRVRPDKCAQLATRPQGGNETSEERSVGLQGGGKHIEGELFWKGVRELPVGHEPKVSNSSRRIEGE